jgi:hypothetical protein
LWGRPVLIGDGKKGQIQATCILTREVDAPAGVKPVEWRLPANRTAVTPGQASELIDWYRATPGVLERPRRYWILFGYHEKKARNDRCKPLIFFTNSGGKCKFRTCDPCSVNAVLYP